MPRFARPCPKCRRLYTGDRCQKCGGSNATGGGPLTPAQQLQRKLKKRFLYGGDYPQRAKLIRETATHCHLCGEIFGPGDTVEADHIFPEQGAASPLGGAHRACNQARGNRPLPW